jgi:integrase/recombinase XerD
MIKHMKLHRLSRATQRNYFRGMLRFANCLGQPPDTATDEDLRRYQIEQSEAGLSAPAMNIAVSVLQFFCTRTLDRQDLTRKLHRVKHARGRTADAPARMVEGWPPAGVCIPMAGWSPAQSRKPAQFNS